jgi:signal transduction histidine kinase
VTKSLASKTAGLRLLLIIVILAVPMVLFATSYLQKSYRGLKLLQNEKLGTELAHIVTAHHLAGSKVPTNTAFRRIGEIERQLRIPASENFMTHLGHQVAAASETARDIGHAHDHFDGSFAGYLGDISSASGLILDSEESSFHLANALTIFLPSIVNNADNVITQLNLKDSGPSARLQNAVLSGHILEVAGRLEDSITRSKAGEVSAVEFEALDQGVKNIKTAAVRLSNQLIFGMASGDADILRQEIRNFWSAAHMIVVPGYELLTQKLDARIVAEQRRMIIVSCLGVLSSFLALGLAASMFSKTLKRLDEVETAQKLSDDMRLETERINAEVAALNDNLSSKLKELKAAQDELLNKGKMEQLGQLTATVAHEIRNPLGAVRTSAFVIGRKIQGRDTGIEPQLDRINNGISRCDAIITQLLDFSRTKGVQTQPAKLDDWLEKIVREDCEALPASVSIECELGLSEIEVSFDDARLRRAVSNLMTNACEAMVGKDKDAASTSIANPKVKVSTRCVGNEVFIDVADNGPGMPAEVLSRIREPLFTTKNFGTGLGIPAVEQIAIQHGGRLDIESEPGVGSKFSICLPLEKSQERVAA